MRETLNKTSFNSIILNLMDISDFAWGEYQFRRDIFAKKINSQQRKKMILSSVACGIEAAEKVISKYGSKFSMLELLDEFHIELNHKKEERIGNRILFGIYIPPSEILIMDNPIKKMVDYQEKIILQEGQIRDLILAHELFHHIESQDLEIYTQKKQISLWKFLFYTHKSNIPSLSEISAMSFSKRINQVKFSPYLLEVAMVWIYNQALGNELYKEVIEIEKEKNMKTLIESNE